MQFPLISAYWQIPNGVVIPALGYIPGVFWVLGVFCIKYTLVNIIDINANISDNVIASFMLFPLQKRVTK